MTTPAAAPDPDSANTACHHGSPPAGADAPLIHTPGVDPRDGVERYLLSSGTGVDVMGLQTWELPASVRHHVTTAWPRTGFPKEFRALWKAEAKLVPGGRAAYLRRWAGFDLATRIAPLPR